MRVCGGAAMRRPNFRVGERLPSMLEHDPEKWKPVFRKDHAQTKRSDHDAIPSNRIMI
jgi:hypothetical protein